MIGNAYKQVQGLSDEQLLKERQMPSGTMPMYLVITEMEKRAAIRKEQQQPAPQGNVADQTTDAFRKEIEESSRQQMAESGIGAIHSPTLTAASGGLVAFDGGGPVRHFYEGDPVEESTSTAGRALRGIKDFFKDSMDRDAEQRRLSYEADKAKPGFFESLTPSQRAERLARSQGFINQAATLRGDSKPKSEELKTIPRLPDAPEGTQIRPYSGVDEITIPEDAGTVPDLNAPSKAAAPAAPVRATRPPAKPTPSSQDMLRADLGKLGLGPETPEQATASRLAARNRVKELQGDLEKMFPDTNAGYSAEIAAKRAQLKDKEHSDFWTTILGAGLKGASGDNRTPGMAGVIQSLSGTGANAVEGIQKLAGERQKRDDLLMESQRQMNTANQARRMGLFQHAEASEAAAQAAIAAAKTQGMQYAQMIHAAGVTDKQLVLLQQQVAAAEKQAAKPSSFMEQLTAWQNPAFKPILQEMEFQKKLEPFLARMGSEYKAVYGGDPMANTEQFDAFVNKNLKMLRTQSRAGLGDIINIPPKTPG